MCPNKSSKPKIKQYSHKFADRSDNGFSLPNSFSTSINPPSGPNGKYFMRFHLRTLQY